LFHPVFIPTYAVYLLLNNSAFKVSEKLGFLIYTVVFLNTCLLPLFSTLLMKKFGLVSSMQVNHQGERNMPYMTSIIFFGSTWWLLSKAPLPPIVAQLMLGATTAILFTAIINLKIKISAHMVGIGGLAGAFLMLGFNGLHDYTLWVILSFLLSGIIGWARLQLKAHSPFEIYSGFLLGMMCQIVVDYIG
jgi:membrane-associated phospholipid phosphatase